MLSPVVDTSLWKKIELYCLNHKEPVPMEIVQNEAIFKTPFYACSDQIHDRGHCANRLNLDDYKELIMKFCQVISQEDAMFSDFTNYEFDYFRSRQKIHVKVLKYSEERICLGIYNVTILG